MQRLPDGNSDFNFSWECVWIWRGKSSERFLDFGKLAGFYFFEKVWRKLRTVLEFQSRREMTRSEN